MKEFLTDIKQHPILAFMFAVALVAFFALPGIAIAIVIAIIFLFEPKTSPTDDFVVVQTPKLPIEMSDEDKQTYLKSESWWIKKVAVKGRDDYECQTCNSERNLEVHHITYELLGEENLDHLVTLCQPCHQALHDELGYSRYTLYPIKRKSK